MITTKFSFCLKDKDGTIVSRMTAGGNLTNYEIIEIAKNRANEFGMFLMWVKYQKVKIYEKDAKRMVDEK